MCLACRTYLNRAYTRTLMYVKHVGRSACTERSTGNPRRASSFSEGELGFLFLVQDGNGNLNNALVLFRSKKPPRPSSSGRLSSSSTTRRFFRSSSSSASVQCGCKKEAFYTGTATHDRGPSLGMIRYNPSRSPASAGPVLSEKVCSSSSCFQEAGWEAGDQESLLKGHGTPPTESPSSSYLSLRQSQEQKILQTGDATARWRTRKVAGDHRGGGEEGLDDEFSGEEDRFFFFSYRKNGSTPFVSPSSSSQEKEEVSSSSSSSSSFSSSSYDDSRSELEGDEDSRRNGRRSRSGQRKEEKDEEEKVENLESRKTQEKKDSPPGSHAEKDSGGGGGARHWARCPVLVLQRRCKERGLPCVRRFQRLVSPLLPFRCLLCRAGFP